MLEHFFGSKTRLKLLKVFFRQPERAFYVRELARQIDTHLHAVRREIANLEKVQIIQQVESAVAVHDEETGTQRSKFYQLDPMCPILMELKALLTKAELLEEKELVEEIKGKGGVLSLFVLTGLFTEEKSASTDILLVGKLKPQILSKLIQKYETDLGKTIRYTFMTDEEFKDRRHIGDRFLYGVLEGKHIFVVNDYNLS